MKTYKVGTFYFEGTNPKHLRSYVAVVKTSDSHWPIWVIDTVAACNAEEARRMAIERRRERELAQREKWLK